jgi:hypothetical protein
MRRGSPKHVRPFRFFFGTGAGPGGVQPGEAGLPCPVGGGEGDAGALGRLRQGRAAGDAEFDELRLERGAEREPLQGPQQVQDVLRGPLAPRSARSRLGAGREIVATDMTLKSQGEAEPPDAATWRRLRGELYADGARSRSPIGPKARAIDEWP